MTQIETVNEGAKTFRRGEVLPLIGLVVSAALALAGSPAVADGPNPKEWSDALDAATTGDGITVYTAKKIYTMNPGQPEAEAIAILDGKILSVGTVEEMQPWLSRYNHRIDDTLADKIVLPGFIEPHTHMYMSAGFMSSLYIGPLDWPGRNGTNPAVPTHEDILSTLAAAIEKEGPTEKPLIAWGFDPAQHGGELNRKELDAISTERPIFVIGFAPHFAFLNTPAIELTGIADDTDMLGAYKNDDGTLSGVFNENPAVQMALAPIFKDLIVSGGVNGAGLVFMAGIAQRAGITTAAELIFGAIDFDQEWKDSVTATSDPDFPMRLILVPDANTLDTKYGPDALANYREMEARGSNKLWVHGVKVFTDGSLPLMSSRVNFPGYLDGTNGSFNSIPWDTMTSRMIPFWDENIQIHIHANGDMALDQALDSLAELQEHKPRFDHRYTIEHFSISNQMQARRIAALGAVVSANVYFAHFRSQLHADKAYGPDRSSGFARLGDLVRENVPFAIHSDYPQVVVPMLPLTGVWTAVNRVAEDGKTVKDPGQRIDVERAFRSITIDAAYVLGAEDKIGSLEPGKFADFAILEGDPFEVDMMEIKDVPVWGTALSGVVFPIAE